MEFSQLGNLPDILWEMSSKDPVKYVVNVMDFITKNTIYKADAEDFTKYPLETLVDKTGDCEDTAVLAAAFFAAKNIPTGIAYSPDHAAVAVSFEYEGRTHYPITTQAAELFAKTGVADTASFNPSEIVPYSYREF